ncbi:hypothetical protein CYY_008249 [Polysphondylium violaceum]|uniref:Tetratricopeptide-like helical domain-containing protein n=1 Tax=Polysphondylium violaceum TaxID=133409 RepID=A0A8J4UXG0_9MYCE|nr:hypothetical protein CYY_008249 [Polysphondylium violaceum]
MMNNTIRSIVCRLGTSGVKRHFSTSNRLFSINSSRVKSNSNKQSLLLFSSSKLQNNNNYSIKGYCTSTNNNNEVVNDSKKAYDSLIDSAIDNVNKQQYDLSLEFLNRAIKLNQGDPSAYSLRGDIYEFQKEYEKAIQDYQKLLELVPNAIPCYSSLASCYSSLGQDDKAIKHFEHILYIDPDYLPANGHLGDLYLNKGDLNKALEYYKKVLAKDPGNLQGLLGLGYLAMRQDNLDNAIQIFKQVVKMTKGKDMDTLSTQVSMSTEGPRIKRPIEENPVYSATIGLATIYRMKGEVDESYLHYYKATEMNPFNSTFFSIMASMKVSMGETEEALKNVEKALDIDPLSTFNLVIKADILFDLGRYRESKDIYKTVVANLLEKEDEQSALTRVNIFHNMILCNVNLLNEAGDLEISDLGISISEKDIDEFLAKPESLYELSKKARGLAKLFKDIGDSKIDDSASDKKDYMNNVIDTLNSIVLACSDSIQITSKEQVNPNFVAIDETLFYYYECLSSSLLIKK